MHNRDWNKHMRIEYADFLEMRDAKKSMLENNAHKMFSTF